jgi:hypothetical protein
MFGPAAIAAAGGLMEDCAMGSPPVRRYALIPGPPETADGVRHPIRRFHLARVAVSPRSALGEDRHERMEEVAGRDADRRGG